MSRLPTDLVPIPTQPWDCRPDDLPLDIEECRTALWMCEGNITAAAALLKVDSRRLRSFVNSSKYLSDQAQEAREQLCDLAEGVVRDALQDEQDKSRRDTMARYVLTNLGSSRGYGAKGGKNLTINNQGGNISISWADNTQINSGDDAKVVDGEVVNG